MPSLVETQTIHIKKTDQFALWLSRHWLAVVNVFLGIFVILPFLAPVFMSIGWTILGKAIYWVYSFLCHQLPERSYFLFGSKISYTLPEIQSAWQNTDNIAFLRQFAGNSQMGWKVGWSDRMVSMYTSLWGFGILWGVFRKKNLQLPWWGAFLMLLPMAIDGTTHLISDFAGIGQGFRDSNIWLATLTNDIFATTFYTGDAWGSFNAWMRLISGVLFGLGIIWFGLPFLDEAFTNSGQVIIDKYQYRTWLRAEKTRLLNLTLIAGTGQGSNISDRKETK
ncbi:MAG: hypothetical protein FD147_509 [Chloroflexi bacterium]|nr:MAG: hypothetical protein FD147_509 [Chloroflexota bacterium]MBA4376126.1 hypothetical protein [Anaerolinea sp.]